MKTLFPLLKGSLGLAMSIFVFSCSNSSSDSSSLEEKVEAAIDKSDKSPCDFIDEDDIRSIFGVGTEVTMDKNDRFGICSFNWEVESEQASDDERLKATLEATKSGDMDKIVAISSQGTYSVGLNFTTAKPSSAADARKTYDTILKRMSEGITVKKEDIIKKAEEMGLDSKAIESHAEDTTISDGSHESVSGVGDAASWSSKTSQLTVLSGTDIFFLTVKASGDKEKSLSKAKELAESVIDNL
ncbi:hypothetical protein LAG90_16370 [Marinilongibacter aquaticus]|uniref:hypothetical protein n=1 Tax=Marinilongibacter aquaticus TaxID=2975157 RepID=UPI0021BD0020|nr:hypothetical protein [Marinilongibacter aquaticus]UBM58380.1 hypothetical protein LAG90_16370 [Marinilongibacter aquaticus]